jgi:tRNA-modifying protein YgfZ
MAHTLFDLREVGLISLTGEDAAAFLHGQLTSDVNGLAPGRTQYSGYCSPKGRLIATFLIWRHSDRILLQLPAELRETVQNRLSKYVLRARVKVADASGHFRLFGVEGPDAAHSVLGLVGSTPEEMHATVSADAVSVTRVPIDRYLVLASRERVDAAQTAVSQNAILSDDSGWRALDVEAGIAIITTTHQEKFVPQMVNLDLIGGVSYTKGCYPGQEVVARTHYLGTQKQRMYRIRVPGRGALSAGDPLYSAAFGTQASGSIVTVGAQHDASCEALAVIQKRSLEEDVVHAQELDGPSIEPLTLPYNVPA